MAFYEAAAQVIALLFAVLAFEERLFSKVRLFGTDLPRDIGELDEPDANLSWSVWAIWVASMLVVGEIASLYVLAQEEPSSLAQGVVFTAIVAGGTAVAGAPIGKQLGVIRRSTNPSKKLIPVMTATLLVLTGFGIWLFSF